MSAEGSFRPSDRHPESTDATFASPTSKAHSIDPLSESLVCFENWWQEQGLLHHVELEANSRSPRPFASINDEELNSLNGIFTPANTPPFQTRSSVAYSITFTTNTGQPPRPVCASVHQVVRPDSRGIAYKGPVPNNVEPFLRQEQVEVLTGTDKVGYVTFDLEVVSGANPMAANALDNKFVEMLKAQ
ncbi:hypothetical protein K466DRAFT_598819 [Polyporus arcularius HHB13444]|uniref:Uncharacterized protein n=1 Tax=Polyporus arcularius HHB13444 TaxID=1314778 RepID=A0A5C3PIS4_9APHY|nr:hypothetical protein K466DRAFT_598819 [Polyporus arcularius HHB13444]